MDSNTNSRIQECLRNNRYIQKYIKGFDARTKELVLNYKQGERRITIDSLEKINSEEMLISFLEGKSISNESPVENVVEEVKQPIPAMQAELVESEDLSKHTLKDIKLLTELKNKNGLDNVLKEIAINPTTGLIDINYAISKVTKNTMEEVEKSINNNYEFSDDLSKFDLDGKYNGSLVEGNSTTDEKIIKSFGNIKVLLDASKMYPEQANYNDEQISAFMKTYMNKVKEVLQKDVSKANYVDTVAPTQDINNVPVAKAGFADIFVLTFIVLVYAVIIVNLILKLS